MTMKRSFQLLVALIIGLISIASAENVTNERFTSSNDPFMTSIPSANPPSSQAPSFSGSSPQEPTKNNHPGIHDQLNRPPQPAPQSPVNTNSKSFSEATKSGAPAFELGRDSPPLNNGPGNEPSTPLSEVPFEKKIFESQSDDETDDSEDASSSESKSESWEEEHKEHKDHHENHAHSQSEATPPIDAKGQNITYIILVSYIKSGSAFVGDVMQQPDAIFYVYEPLKYFDYNHKVGLENEGEALSIVENILQCSIEKDEKPYSEWLCDGDEFEAGLSITRNSYLWDSCDYNSSICCDMEYVDKVCSKTPVRIIKETRLSLESVEKLLERSPSSINVKVVFLVRDPRGIYSARKHYKWCKTPGCVDYEQLCEDFTSDLEVYPRLVKKYGDRIMALRFEDIALNPYVKSESLYKHLGLDYTNEVADFIETHTDASIETHDHFSVLHNSKDIITKWMTKLNESVVDSLQNSCSSVLKQLGYGTIAISEIDPNDDNLLKIYSETYSLPNQV